MNFAQENDFKGILPKQVHRIPCGLIKKFLADELQSQSSSRGTFGY